MVFHLLSWHRIFLLPSTLSSSLLWLPLCLHWSSTGRKPSLTGHLCHMNLILAPLSSTLKLLLVFSCFGSLIIEEGGPACLDHHCNAGEYHTGTGQAPSRCLVRIPWMNTEWKDQSREWQTTARGNQGRISKLQFSWHTEVWASSHIYRSASSYTMRSFPLDIKRSIIFLQTTKHVHFYAKNHNFIKQSKQESTWHVYTSY